MQVDTIYTVGIIGENQITRLGLDRLISNFKNFNVELTNASIEKALPVLWKCNLILYAVSSGCEQAIAGLKQLQSKGRGVPILIYCLELDKTGHQKLVQVGVQGIISYDLDQTKLEKVLTCLVYGGTHFPDSVQQDIQQASFRPMARKMIGEIFTPIKIEILKLLAEGCTAKQIGQKLHRCRGDIEWHKRDMRQIIKVKTTAKLLLFAKEYELIIPNFNKIARPRAKSINFPTAASPLKVS